MAFRVKPGDEPIKQLIVRFAKEGTLVDGADLAALANFKVGELAKCAGLSLRQLQRRFQMELGVSPKQWLQRRRLEIARTLEAKGLRAKQIAAELRFTDTSHFLKVKARGTRTDSRHRRVRTSS